MLFFMLKFYNNLLLVGSALSFLNLEYFLSLKGTNRNLPRRSSYVIGDFRNRASKRSGYAFEPIFFNNIHSNA